MPNLKFKDKFYKEPTLFCNHVLIVALRVLGEKFMHKDFRFGKYLDQLTNSVDVLHLIDDLAAAGVKFAPNFKEGVETLYADDIDEANQDGTDVLALLNGLKRFF